ncbi:transporter [Escherichia coli]|nr:transporter [Escherichia coli]
MTIEKHERSTKDLVKAAVSGWLGTALEFMDFQLYFARRSVSVS